MRKIAAAVFLLVASCAAFISPSTAALTTVSAPFVLTKPTAGPVLQPPAGSQTCWVMLNGPPAYAFLAPQQSDNAYVWKALGFQTGLDITQGMGLYYGTVSNAYFRFILSQVNWPGVTGYETCSNQFQAPVYPGQNVTLSNVTVDQLTDDNLNGCVIATNGVFTAVPLPCSSGLAGPTPYPTPSIFATATACGAPVAGGVSQVLVPICGTPYPTPTVSATATACGAPVSASGQTVNVPVCATPTPFTLQVQASPCATPTANGNTFIFCTNQFEAAVLHRADVTHLWGMHENPAGCASNCTPGPCPTSIADLIGLGATAAPAPTAAQASQTSNAPMPECGMPPVMPGAATSMGFCRNTGPGLTTCGLTAVGGFQYLNIPAGTLPATPYTVFCVFNPISNTTLNDSLWVRDSAGGGAQNNDLAARVQANQVVTMVVNNGNAGGTNSLFYPGKMLWALVNDGTTLTTDVNGVVAASSTTVPSPSPTPPGNSNAFFAEYIGGQAQYIGTAEDCGYANTAWSLQTQQYLYTLTGF